MLCEIPAGGSSSGSACPFHGLVALRAAGLIRPASGQPGRSGNGPRRWLAADSNREPSCRNERTAGSVALREPFGDAPARVRASIRGDLERDGFGHGWPGKLVSQCPQPVGQSHLVGLPLLGRGCLTSAATTAYRRQLDRVKKTDRTDGEVSRQPFTPASPAPAL